jgi:hypothetical protein
MKIFLQKLALFCLLNIGIAIVFFFLVNKIFIKKGWERDTSVFVIPQHQIYDFLIMGASHGKIFSEFHNQETVENILSQKYLNLAQNNAGPVLEKTYLDFFLQKDNHAKKIIYFVDPFVFYSPSFNEKYSMVPYGMADVSFLSTMISNHFSSEVIIRYLKAYLSLKWFIKQPYLQGLDINTVGQINPEAVRKRKEVLYPDGLNDTQLNEKMAILESLIKEAQANHMVVYLVQPPTLLGDLPGNDTVKEKILKLKQKYAVVYVDYSQVLQDPNLYSDHDHLNNAGVKAFTENYLKQIVAEK